MKNIYQITRKNFKRYNYVRCIVIAESEDKAKIEAYPIVGINTSDNFEIIKLGSTNTVGVQTAVCTELNSKN